MAKSNVLTQDLDYGLPPDVPVGDRNLYYEDSRVRSIVKALSWRITALIVTSIVVWVVTSSLEFAAVVAAADTVLKIFLYYFHERMWNRSGFGRKTRGDERSI